MDKDIEQLIKRFMDGLTSVEEEERITEFFRTHDVEDEWKAYKDMFMWFDEGMPAIQQEKQNTNKRRHINRIIIAVAAAAAAVAAIVMTTKPSGTDIMPEAQTEKIVSAIRPDNKDMDTNDTLAIDSVKIETDKTYKKKPRHIRKTYYVTPPKTYMAENRHDSTSIAASKMAEEILQQIYAEQNLKLKEMYDLYNKQDMEIELIMATLEEGIDYEYENEEQEYEYY